jgi:phthiodiolone/phenolphthiodiolone dimycocerosates ketoreductase
VGKLEDMISAIRVAWESQGKPLDHQGPFHHWENATFAVPPYAGSFPPIYVAAQGPRACSVAGRFGDGWIQVNEGPDAWRQGCERVVRAAAGAGRDLDQIDRMLILPCLVVGSSEDLQTICSQPFVRSFLVGCYTGRQWSAVGLDHPFGPEFGGYREIDPTTFPVDRLIEAGRAVTPTVAEGLLSCGSARTITASLREYVDEGLTHVLVANLAAVYAMKAGLLGTFREQRRLLRSVKNLRVQPLRRPQPAEAAV